MTDIAYVSQDSWEQIVKMVCKFGDNFYGEKLTDFSDFLVCPEGYYGQHCLGECACKSDRFVCHAAHGCICRQGFTGEDCSKSKHDAQEQVKEESNSAGVAWGVTVSLVLVGIIVMVLLYYRRRIRDLKTTIADVEFHANPQTQPDRHHFDNPVYAFQTATSNDNTQLLNNLRPSKPTNLERYKLGFSDTDSNASSRGMLLEMK